jgi:hypothetical protein
MMLEYMFLESRHMRFDGRLHLLIIKRCYATGNVTSVAGSHGGFVGANGSWISECYATGNVEGDSCLVGGFVGYTSGAIRDSYARGDVNALGGTPH